MPLPVRNAVAGLQAAESRHGLSGGTVKDLAQPGHQDSGSQAVGAERADEVGISQERAMAEIDTVVAELIKFFRRPATAWNARDVSGDAMGGGKLIPQNRQAAVAGTQIVAFPGDESVVHLEIEFPAQVVVGEDLTTGDAAGSHPFEEKQSGIRFQLDHRALVVARSGLGDERLWDPLEEGVSLDPQVLVAQRGCLTAGPVDP